MGSEACTVRVPDALPKFCFRAPSFVRSLFTHKHKHYAQKEDEWACGFGQSHAPSPLLPERGQGPRRCDSLHRPGSYRPLLFVFLAALAARLDLTLFNFMPKFVPLMFLRPQVAISGRQDSHRFYSYASSCHFPLLCQVRTLIPKVEKFIHNNGTESELLVLSGTVAINYQSRQYNIPVEVYISEPYPEVSPECELAAPRRVVRQLGHRGGRKAEEVHFPPAKA